MGRCSKWKNKVLGESGKTKRQTEIADCTSLGIIGVSPHPPGCLVNPDDCGDLVGDDGVGL